MVEVRVIGRPEELVVTHVLHDVRQRALVRVARNPALAPEIDAGLFLERHAVAQGRLEGGVHAVQRGPDPARARFEQHDLDVREAVKQSPLEQAVQGLLRPLHAQRILQPARGLHAVEALVGPNFGVLGHRMNGDRHAEVLRPGPEGVVVGMGVRNARQRVRGQKRALGPFAYRPLQFRGRGHRIGQRDVRNGDQAAVGVRAEVADPAVVGFRVRQ